MFESRGNCSCLINLHLQLDFSAKKGKGTLIDVGSPFFDVQFVSVWFVFARRFVFIFFEWFFFVLAVVSYLLGNIR
jgi:hypothetical protein